MLIKNPGPVNAHSFRKLNPSCKNKKKKKEYLNTRAFCQLKRLVAVHIKHARYFSG